MILQKDPGIQVQVQRDHLLINSNGGILHRALPRRHFVFDCRFEPVSSVFWIQLLIELISMVYSILDIVLS